MADGIQRGLSSREAAALLRRHGPNLMPDRDRHGLAHTLRSVMTEPMFVLLLAAAALYLLIGDLGEGLLLGGFAALTVALVVLQERRRERSLQALRDMAVPMVQALRDGQWKHLPASDIVPGDWVMLSEGDRVAADGRLVESTGLKVEEALLTGESWPVEKACGDAAALPVPVWAGTLVVSGHGVAQVLATGASTRMGQIGQALAGIDLRPTPLALQIRRLVRRFGLLAALASLAVLLVWGWLKQDWVAGALAALALGMGMLPEEFPMALAIFMSMGAWRLSRMHVLARHGSVIEALGTATMLCVDKTGTLTENAQRLVGLFGPGAAEMDKPTPNGPAENIQPLGTLLFAALQASRRARIDPLDRAIHEAAGRAGEQALKYWSLVYEWPPQPGRRFSARLWQGPNGRRVLVVKGAPEDIMVRCGMTDAARDRELGEVSALAARGLRLLAVASFEASGSDHALGVTGQPQDFGPQPPPVVLEWLGLLAFEDPMRITVPTAVAQASEAGMSVCVITGDHEQTALSIARQAGIDTRGGAVNGEQWEAMDGAARRAAISGVRVFARISPLQKLALVRELQNAGHVVAMTGDGVNDAPALKAAHIGVAMGRRGTDVAREAAGLVLMREDFGDLVAAIAMGRSIFDNLRKVSAYIVGIHLPLAGLALLPLLLGWPPMMGPAHVVLTEMLIDPLCSLAFEAGPPSRDVMKRPPRPASEPLMTRRHMAASLALGLALLAAIMAASATARLWLQWPDEQVRGVALTSLLAGNLTLAALELGLFWGQAWRSRAARVFAGAGGAAVGLWLLGLYQPQLQTLLQIQPAPPPVVVFTALATCSVVGLAWRMLKR